MLKEQIAVNIAHQPEKEKLRTQSEFVKDSVYYYCYEEFFQRKKGTRVQQVHLSYDKSNVKCHFRGVSYLLHLYTGNLQRAQRFWEEDRPLGMVDQTIVEFCNKSEFLKCIFIGLSCVQEDPGDRPTMSNTVFMLGTEFKNLPRPKQPAFVAKTNQQILSNNELTVSTIKGR
ncbi:hypothetical protein LguiB_002459 [Lonicera macranthoides]